MIVCLGTTPTLARTMEFERLAVDGVNRAARVHEYAAGKAVNAARAIATLGERATCVGPIGGGTGERLRTLTGEFTPHHDFQKVAAATRLCITVVDRTARTSTELIEESGRLTATEGERLLATLAQHLERADLCVLAGSLAPGVDPAFYARCVRACRAVGVRTIIDASGEPLEAAIDEWPEYIKVNAGELATIENVRGDDDASIAEAALTLARRSRGWVVVTRGRDATIAANAGEAAIRVDVPAVEVVSPIGSGDSFAGGLAVGLVRDMPIESALRLATACASANAMTADAAHFDAATVESLQTKIETRQL